jgi:hypothetical protein
MSKQQRRSVAAVQTIVNQPVDPVSSRIRHLHIDHPPGASNLCFMCAADSAKSFMHMLAGPAEQFASGRHPRVTVRTVGCATNGRSLCSSCGRPLDARLT